MKFAAFFRTMFIFLGLAIFASCSANLFSYLNPTDPSLVNDPNILVAMGDKYVAQLDYTNAYLAYSRAIELDADNSRALEGAALAYIYMRFDFNTLYTCITAGSFTSLGGNGFFNVSAVVSRNLMKIISGQGDGVIPPNDVNDNLNYFIFGGYYSVFYMMDSDSDDDIDFDTNDYIIMDSNFVTSNRVFDVISNGLTSSNLIPVIGMAYKFNHIRWPGYTNLRYWSDRSLGVIAGALYNEETLQVLTQISNIFVTYDTNFQTFFTFFQTNSIIGLLGVGNYDLLTNFFPSEYSNFSNLMYQEGMWPPSELSNAMPDMTNLYPVLTNFYLRPSLD